AGAQPADRFDPGRHHLRPGERPVLHAGEPVHPPAAGGLGRYARRGPDPGDPYRRDRSVHRCGHGAVVPGDGKAGSRQRDPRTGSTISIGNFHLTVGVLMMLLLYVIFAYVLRQTAWGRHVYATGDDPEAARLAGIRINRVLLSVYVVAGAVTGIAAWILVGRINGADPNAGINANLESITAVVIGGTSLFGGRGAVVGSLIGALIVQVFENGLALAGVDPYYQVLTVGVLVIAAVAAD